jgi:Cof subfamily protein (haloacid dehalogenase superfamily)
MPIKLLAVDLDGTLVADLHTIPSRTQAAIKATVAQGVIVTIATGREYEITHQFANLLGLTGPIICFQGAVIQDAHTGASIASETLSLAATHRLIDVSRSLNVTLTLYGSGIAYSEQMTPQGKIFFNNIGTTMIEVKDLKQAVTNRPIKGMIIHSPEEGEAICAQLQANLDGVLKVFRSLENLIEITAANVSKGHALATLAAHYGIDQGDVMAIGDQDNDVDMIAWAGIGVAMGNASPNAKAAADHIAPPLAEEGAAWAIEHFILEQV